MSGKAVVVYVEEMAEIDEEAWQKIRSAVLGAKYISAPLVQTILLERRDSGSGSKVTLRPFSGVLQP